MDSGRWLAHAEVPTPRAERYAKQLASYLGTRCEVTPEPPGFRVRFGPEYAVGDCVVTPGAEFLDLAVSAQGEADLDFIKRVMGTHLEANGRRDKLAVQWQ